MTDSGRRDLALAAVLLLAAVALPWLTDSRYVVGQGIFFLIYLTVVAQWNLVFGYAGVFSLAQMAIFAFGAYGTAMLGFWTGLDLWAAMPVAALGAVGFSVVVGLACLRLSGAYVALLTLAVAQAMLVMIVTDSDCLPLDAGGCQFLTGGTQGLARFGDLGTRALFKADWLKADYYLALLLAAAGLLFVYLTVRSPVGLAFRAIKGNAAYAKARGLNRFHAQVLIFGLSAFFTGLAGAFYAAHLRVIGPTVLDFSLMIYLAAMMVVGGIGSFWGPVVGALALTLLTELLKETEGFREIGYGALLLLFALLLPKGIVGHLTLWLRRRRRAGSTPNNDP